MLGTCFFYVHNCNLLKLELTEKTSVPVCVEIEEDVAPNGEASLVDGGETLTGCGGDAQTGITDLIRTAGAIRYMDRGMRTIEEGIGPPPNSLLVISGTDMGNRGNELGMRLDP